MMKYRSKTYPTDPEAMRDATTHLPGNAPRIGSSPALIPDLWRTIKAARDDAENAANIAARRCEELNDLLARMKAAGMADHLPTIEDVQAAWRGEETDNGH
jgi:hypothetical protein